MINFEKPTICIADNRQTSETGIRLLIASLTENALDWPIYLFLPQLTDDMKMWLQKYPNVSVNRLAVAGDWNGYNIKPTLLLAILSTGAPGAVWIDSDIISMRSIESLSVKMMAGSLILTEEAMSSNRYDGDALRARAWGLNIGRRLPFQLNTAIVGVTAKHIPLLTAWHKVLESPEYISSYLKPWLERPSYYAGDQEVITALLCSTEFSELGLDILRRGRDIIQYFGLAGYSTLERLRHMFVAAPMFIHAQGSKPWLTLPQTSDGMLKRFRGVGPYNYAAAKFSNELSNTDWLSSVQGKVSRSWRITAPISGMALAMAVDLFRVIRWGHTGGEPRKGNRAIATFKEMGGKRK